MLTLRGGRQLFADASERADRLAAKAQPCAAAGLPELKRARAADLAAVRPVVRPG